MFRVKICGITTADDGKLAVDAGADAIGLNFYSRSPRYIQPDLAQAIVDGVGSRAAKIGLFVNAAVAHVLRTFDALQLDAIQLHGDEPPQFLAQLMPRPVVRAFRIGEAGIGFAIDYLRECERLGCSPAMVLFDAQVSGVYGGSGQLGKWDSAAQFARMPEHPPLVIAGGLTPWNVAEAVRSVRPAAVDTASGVEMSPGRKSPDLVSAFVAAARQAFETA